MNDQSIVERANVLGVGVHAVDMEDAIRLMIEAVERRRKGYVCLASAHGVVESERDPALRGILDKAMLVLPDGMPLVWVARLQGFAGVRRVFGPELMLKVLQREDLRTVRHFFCGGEAGVAEELREQMERRFPWLQVCGTFTPPFRVMLRGEEEEFVTEVAEAQPDIVWVGLSTPKQERFMARYVAQLDTTLLVGVGAAFLLHTGAIQDSPQWVKGAGLQWLHRLMQEPRRLWRRYALVVPGFLFQSMLQLSGLRRWELTHEAVMPECRGGREDAS
jgi:N-acetylglucosaminyldiphosphoundecaprenol N-acetyl-beta-D-mannosaminyltransferase